MKSKNSIFKKLLLGFYALVMLNGLWGLYVILSGHWTNMTQFNDKHPYATFSDFSILTQIFGVLSVAIAILSLVVLILVFVKKLPKYHYIYPLYEVLWTLILWGILPMIFTKYCLSSVPVTEGLSCTFSLMDKAMILDFLHPFIQIILPVIMVRKILKERN